MPFFAGDEMADFDMKLAFFATFSMTKPLTFYQLEIQIVVKLHIVNVDINLDKPEGLYCEIYALFLCSGLCTCPFQYDNKKH